MFEYIVLCTATLIAISAAIFSVTGIAQLFAGATLAAGIMATSLEIGKLVTVSLLYRYWITLPRLLKRYLIFGTVLLMLITSIGIYGYLSSAYATSAVGIDKIQNNITLYSSQQKTLTGIIAQDSSRLSQLQKIQAQQENRLDSLVSKNRNTYSQQRLVKENTDQINKLQQSISVAKYSVDSLEMIKTTATSSIGTTGKLGTFYYVAKTFGISLDTLVKWFIFIIVLTFDPLSVSLFVAYNVMLKHKKTVVIPSTSQSTASIDAVESTQSVTQESEPAVITEVAEDHSPYYMRSDFDWENDPRMQTDPVARGYHMNKGYREPKA